MCVERTKATPDLLGEYTAYNGRSVKPLHLTICSENTLNLCCCIHASHTQTHSASISEQAIDYKSLLINVLVPGHMHISGEAIMKWYRAVHRLSNAMAKMVAMATRQHTQTGPKQAKYERKTQTKPRKRGKSDRRNARGISRVREEVETMKTLSHNQTSQKVT